MISSTDSGSLDSGVLVKMKYVAYNILSTDSRENQPLSLYTHALLTQPTNEQVVRQKSFGLYISRLKIQIVLYMSVFSLTSQNYLSDGSTRSRIEAHYISRKKITNEIKKRLFETHSTTGRDRGRIMKISNNSRKSLHSNDIKEYQKYLAQVFSSCLGLIVFIFKVVSVRSSSWLKRYENILRTRQKKYK